MVEHYTALLLFKLKNCVLCRKTAFGRHYLPDKGVHLSRGRFISDPQGMEEEGRRQRHLPRIAGERGLPKRRGVTSSGGGEKEG